MPTSSRIWVSLSTGMSAPSSASSSRLRVTGIAGAPTRTEGPAFGPHPPGARLRGPIGAATGGRPRAGSASARGVRDRSDSHPSRTRTVGHRRGSRSRHGGTRMTRVVPLPEPARRRRRREQEGKYEPGTSPAEPSRRTVPSIRLPTHRREATGRMADAGPEALPTHPIASARRVYPRSGGHQASDPVKCRVWCRARVQVAQPP